LQPTALLGKNLIAEIIAKAGDRISIMPGSGVTEDNIAEIYETTKAKEFHMSLRKVVDGQMIYRSNQLKLSASSEFPEFGTLVTEATRVKKVREILNQF
jgi:copper homeostasis protein